MKMAWKRALTAPAAVLAAGCLTAGVAMAAGLAPADDERVMAALQSELSADREGSANTELRRARTVARFICREMELKGACRVQSISHQSLLPDIDVVSYTIQIRAAQDVIVVHRAVSPEHEPGQDAVLFNKGVGGRWIELYFPAPFFGNLTEDFSPIVTLVRDGIDVWGLDFRWDQVPAGTQNFNFMADWGLATTVADARFTARFARYMRLLEGSGFARLVISGYSAGVPLAYAVASVDSQQNVQRDIRALAVIDNLFKIDPSDTPAQDFTCPDLPFYEEALDNGIFASSSEGLIAIADLAANAPDGASPFDPNFTNEEFLSLILLLPFSEDFPYHVFGGDFDEEGKPFLLYADIRGVALQALTFSPFSPVAYSRDTTEIACTPGTVGPFDQLASIDVPVLVVAAAGGVNESSLYGANLTAGPVESLIVRVLEEGQEVRDWGHGDIFLVPGADELLFTPISEWIQRLP